VDSAVLQGEKDEVGGKRFQQAIESQYFRDGAADNSMYILAKGGGVAEKVLKKKKKLKSRSRHVVTCRKEKNKKLKSVGKERTAVRDEFLQKEKLSSRGQRNHSGPLKTAQEQRATPLTDGKYEGSPLIRKKRGGWGQH